MQRLWSSADFWNQQQRRQPCEKLQHSVSAKALLKSMHQHQSKCLGLSLQVSFTFSTMNTVCCGHAHVAYIALAMMLPVRHVHQIMTTQVHIECKALKCSAISCCGLLAEVWFPASMSAVTLTLNTGNCILGISDCLTFTVPKLMLLPHSTCNPAVIVRIITAGI